MTPERPIAYERVATVTSEAEPHDAREGATVLRVKLFAKVFCP